MANEKLHLVHVKSSQIGKAPSAATLNYGEIAVNYNVDSPALYIKDSADNIVKFWPEGGNAKIFYGECSSPASATTKTVVCTAFTSEDLVEGAIVYVKFTNTSSAAVSSTTLNVNSTGAYHIKKIKNNSGFSNLDYAAELTAHMTQAFTFTGSYWAILGVDKDSNTTYTLSNLMEGNGAYIADSTIYRYQILFQRGGENSNKLTPLTNVSNTSGATKAMNTGVTFNPFGEIYYRPSTGTVSTNAAIAGAELHYHYQGLNLRYTFNISSTTGNVLDVNKPVYLKVQPQSDGMVKIVTDSDGKSGTLLVNDLPNTNDGFWYIFLGRTTATSYTMTLYTEHPVYTYNGTEIVELLNPEIMAGLKNSIVTIDSELDSGSTNPVANSAITKVISEDEKVISAAFNDLESRKADKSYVDDAVSSITIDVDSELDTGSTNPVSNSAITTYIYDIEKVTSAALNDLNSRKADKSYVDEAVSSITIDVDSELDSASTNPVENRAIWEVIVENEEVISAAFNDLETRKADKSYVDTAVSSITIDVDSELDTGSTNPVSNSAITTYIYDIEEVTSAALNDLNSRKADKSYVDEEIHPKVKTSMPSGGFEPNIMYKLGTVTGTKTFTLKTTGIDTSIVNHYHFMFNTSSLAPTITWPSQVTSWVGNCLDTSGSPVLSINKRYEISIVDGNGVIIEF